MKKEKVKSKELSVEELLKLVVEKRVELQELRIKVNINEEKDTTKINKAKREIARTMTAIYEKRKIENEPK